MPLKEHGREVGKGRGINGLDNLFLLFCLLYIHLFVSTYHDKTCVYLVVPVFKNWGKSYEWAMMTFSPTVSKGSLSLEDGIMGRVFSFQLYSASMLADHSDLATCMSHHQYCLLNFMVTG